MKGSRRVCIALTFVTLCLYVNGQQGRTTRLRPLDNIMGTDHGPVGQSHSNLLEGGRFLQPNTGKTYGGQHLETFNRPVGTDNLGLTVSGGPSDNMAKFQTAYGRTFGQYGSYRNRQSWQDAVAKDLTNNRFVSPSRLEKQLPWLLKSLPSLSVERFGLNGFWNSYASNPNPQQSTLNSALRGAMVGSIMGTNYI